MGVCTKNEHPKVDEASSKKWCYLCSMRPKMWPFGRSKFFPVFSFCEKIMYNTKKKNEMRVSNRQTILVKPHPFAVSGKIIGQCEHPLIPCQLLSRVARQC